MRLVMNCVVFHRYIIGCSLIFLLALLSPIAADAADVKEYQLENGPRVVVVEDHKSPLATFQVWYSVGSRDEPSGKSGISHLLEHMMFKGTRKYGPSMLSRIVQRNGGMDNAHTTKDYTAYFEILPADRIGLAIELEADRMSDLTIDPKQVSSERNVVMEERRLRYEDDPQNSLFEEVVAAAFKVHPYHKPVIGWMPEIESIDRGDLLSYYKTHYSADRATIVVVGDVKADEIVEQIRKHFKTVPHENNNQRPAAAEPEQKGERKVTLRREAELPCIIIAYHTPTFPHEDSYALDVLSTVLSAGKSSRLYQSLVYEKKIALGAFADYSGFNKDPYLFTFFATAAPGKEIGGVEDAVNSEIEKIKETVPTEREIQKAKNQIEASFIMGQDSIYAQAMKYGLFEMLGDWRLMDRYLEGIRKVRPEDVSSAAKKYLTEGNRTVGILIPTKKKDSQ